MDVGHIDDSSELRTWRKSTYSGGDNGSCLEVADGYRVVLAREGAACWRKSSHSNANAGDCLEVADGYPVMPVRDSKDPHGPALVFSADAWAAFVAGVKAGEFTR